MANFPAALAFFVLLHIGISATGLRRMLVARFGEGPYRGLFALASALGLGWLIWSFAVTRADPLDPLNAWIWTPPLWARHIGQGLALVGLALALTGIFTPNPTTAGMERALWKEAPATGVLRITRHPFLWGAALWAGGHVLANGERMSFMLFGALCVMALYGTRSIDRKGAARDPEHWAKFAAVTSNVPFAAIVQKRNKLALAEMSWRPVAALLVTAALTYSHMWFIGSVAMP